MAIAWILDARASETCAVRSVSCPRAFSGVADVGLRSSLVCLLECAAQVIQGAQAKGLWCVS